MLNHMHGFVIVCFTSLLLLSCRPIAPVGADGIGDPYYPQLGNGGYDALHYTLTLAVDPESNSLAGTSTMVAQAGAGWELIDRPCSADAALADRGRCRR